MKRLLLLLLALCTAAPSLPAAFYQANAIGQRLEEIEALSGTGYELFEEDGLSIFYSDGSVQRTTLTRGSSETVTEGDEVTVRTYDSLGRLLEETLTTPSGSMRYIYEYSDNGVLDRVIESRDGEEVSATVYSYSDTSLLTRITYISDGESSSYISEDAYQYDEDGSPVRVRAYPGVLVRDAAEGMHEGSYDEGGNLLLSEKSGENTLQTLYSPSGSRLSERLFSPDGTLLSSVSYEYDSEGQLVSMVRESGSERNVSLYDDSGRLYELRSYTDGVIMRERRYHSDGTSAETRYRSGVPYAVVRYGADSLMVTGVEML